MIEKRLGQLRNLLSEKDLAGLFVTNQKNIRYLTGFVGISPHEREATCLVTTDAAYLFLPRMYASKGEGLKAKEAGLVNLVIDDERHGLLTLFSEYVKDNEKIGIEATDVTLAEFDRMKKKVNAELVAEKGMVEKLRVVKDEDEIECLRKAAEITDSVFNKLVEWLRNNDYTKITEQDAVDMMRKFSRKLGGEGFGFDPIVACGIGSSEPHYHTGIKNLEKGQPLLMDFGIKYNGYTADLTRTIFLGEATDRFREIYKKVLACNERCIAACQAGMTGKDLHQVATDYFDHDELNEYFLHSLGHGVGLDIHEAPGVHAGYGRELKENMIITIEPGLYFLNEFGVRIEDMVLVKSDGCEVLSGGSDKGLIQI